MEKLQQSTREPLWTAPMPFREDGSRLINRVLIANRGEIACRIIKTCRLLDIMSIAVYAEEDDTSGHISDADESICLGSMDQTPGNPFLNIGLLISVAKRNRVDAIHPGYGYLSENSQFAKAVRDAGIMFIGPSSDAMSTLGDKREAKEYLAKHEPSIPLIPGWTGSAGEDLDIVELKNHAETIGYPVMIKASAGGGGKGMRIVYDPSAFATELERARSEAQRSFGSNECILEKYIEAGKHVEVQILGDSYGTVLSLWERDCSVQRRHQKVIEESPCTWLTQEQREEMCAAAVRVGKLLDYESAGTVEFIVDIATGKFYFLEVNARLQVEHPITEECTGLDIVSLQLFVASKGRLDSVPWLSTIPQRGHSIECRLCAEDPIRDFAPQHGVVRLWTPSSPDSRDDIRFETALGDGSRISIFFDSMVAKVVVWAPNRSMAINKMIKTLSATACIGPTTNQLFLQSCLSHKSFQTPDYTTSFIADNLDDLLENPHMKFLKLPPASLSVIPCLFLRKVRDTRDSSKERPVFKSIRRGFRNQTFDKVNMPCDIVTTYDAKFGRDINPHVCFWDSEPRMPSAGYTARVAALEISEIEPEIDGGAPKPDPVSRSYNSLSASIRRGSLEGQKVLDVKVLGRIKFNTNTNGWTTGTFKLSIDGETILAHIASTTNYHESDEGESTKIFIHSSILGAPVEYHCYSTLSYFESLRHAIAEGGESGSKTINAPMPCKVLRVLKKNDDMVKMGEVVMIVESMKMEITISAGREGKFETSIKEGDAVDEGTVLCTLS